MGLGHDEGVICGAPGVEDRHRRESALAASASKLCREAALGGEQGASRSVHSVGGENSAREIMKVGLLGITGGVGQRFAKLALDRGHTVVAMARTPAKVTLKHPCLIVIKGDSTSLEAVSDFAAGEAGGQPAAANLHA